MIVELGLSNSAPARRNLGALPFVPSPCYSLAMKKFIAIAFLAALAVAVPAFASHPKVKHPQAHHATNPYLKHPVKHKVQHHK